MFAGISRVAVAAGNAASNAANAITSELSDPQSKLRTDVGKMTNAGLTLVSDSTVVAQSTVRDTTKGILGTVSKALVNQQAAEELLIPGRAAANREHANGAARLAQAAADADTSNEGDSTAPEDERELGSKLHAIPQYMVPVHGARIVFVGAGPVGLFCALQLKLLRPLWSIVCLERFTEYKRKHVLRVHAASFATIVQHPEAAALVQRILGGRDSVSIRTTDIEKTMRTLATALGVVIHCGITVTSLPIADGQWADLSGQYSSCSPPSMSPEVCALLSGASMIVGADGARSVTRRITLAHATKDGTGLSQAETLAYMVHLKYDCVGVTKRLDPITQALPLFRLMGLVGEEYVGREKDGVNGVTACTLALVVDKDTFGHVSHGTFTSPIRLLTAVAAACDAGAPITVLQPASTADGAVPGPLGYTPTQQLPAKLLEAITIWLNAKEDLVSEKRVAGSELITAVNLSVYRAARFVTYASDVLLSSPGLSAAQVHAGTETSTAEVGNASLIPDRVFALVGDSAFGVPYYRALNNGLLGASALARALSDHGNMAGNAWKSAAPARSPPLVQYVKYMEDLTRDEIAAARVKRAVMFGASTVASMAWMLHSVHVPGHVASFVPAVAETFIKPREAYLRPLLQDDASSL